ncbi:MAG: NAD(P)/FAD-dependent oxidoreductase [Candidatus Coatesbacteria bacterium]|nr:NAD(P)/FAD-dependent oxidoreductase [Candidatus Coatesbacteria bacterium]
MPKVYDVAIIGSGPAGSTCAYYLSKAGLQNAILQKGKSVGEPLQCAEGLIRKALLEEWELPLSDKALVSYIDKALIVSPGNIKANVSFPRGGLMLDRRQFDKELANEAVKKGSTLYLDFQATRIEKIDNLWHIYSKDNKLVKSRALIGADGVGSFTGRYLKIIPPLKPEQVHTCFQVIAENVSLERNRIELYLNPEIAPGGYIWVFPKGDSKANIGLGCHRSVWNIRDRTLEKRLMQFIAQRYNDCRITGKIRGITPAVEKFPMMVDDGVIIVGDAAHVTDPFSGGGTHNALRTGHLAAKWLTRAFNERNLSKEFLDGYRREWIERREFVHKLLYKTSTWLRESDDKELDKLVEITQDLFGNISLNELKIPYVLKKVLIHHPVYALKSAGIFLNKK